MTTPLDTRREASLARLGARLEQRAPKKAAWTPPWRQGAEQVVCPRVPRHGLVIAATLDELGQCGACRARFQGRVEAPGRAGFVVPPAAPEAEPQVELW